MADGWRGRLQVTGEMLAWITLGESTWTKDFQSTHWSVLDYKAGFGQLTDDKVDCFPDHIFELQVIGK